MKKSNLNNNIKFWLPILFVVIGIILTCTTTYAASSNPFTTINSHGNEAADGLIKTVQICGIVALGIFVGYSFFTGNLNVMRIIQIIVGVVILALVHPIIDYLMSWKS